jgi:hypothetical protein
VIKRMLLLSTLLAVVCAVLAMAADIGGKWVAQVPGRGGEPMETTFNFKVDGGNLTGTVSSNFGGQAMEQQITEGKVSGEDVSFVTVLSFPGGGGGGEFKFVYKGKIAGSEIKFTRTFSGGGGFGGGGEGPPPQEFVAKKSK